ncbi:MAG: NADH-quinone oxidoreductase subunit L [Alphaproteobacteria bacterium]|nr:NADH-quinone oxidoreductase subunit L [Alphaproteobacteria bacterium]
MHVAAVFLPLIAAFIAGFFGRWIGDRGAQLVTCLALVAAAVLGAIVFWSVAIVGHARTIDLLTWIDAGDLRVRWALRYDTLSAVMVAAVTLVSAMVHIYSVGYMAHDKSVPRFMSYLSLFTFFMLMLVTADNFVQLFFGWEGVGLMSYLLIGFWYDRPSANAAAIKAFIVNRIGDFGFALGIFAVYLIFGSLQFDTVFAAAPDVAHNTIPFLGHQVDAITVTCILLFIGAMGKSAQLGLHTWLPDAMEGPTPVSALIHAATMVTAGVFMLARLSPLFEYSPTALAVVVVIGGSTAMFAATIGMAQNDIKRVIAYSTCSQLGYMFFAAGVSAYGAAIFHLVTHAFFKALLFLAAGSVIHAMSGEQDMRKMGGLRTLIPATYLLMWVGSLALAGIWPFAGYYSKDVIIEAAWASGTGVGHYAYWLGVFAAFLTAFYSWRLIFLTFHGKPRASKEVMAHVHESPPVMILPLLVLAAGALFAGMAGYHWFVGEGRDAFWGDSILVLPGHDNLAGAETVPFWAAKLPLAMGLGGIFVAWIAYVVETGIPALTARWLRPVYLLFLNKWYFDELYDAIIVRPAMWLGIRLWKDGDGAVIDGLGPDGFAKVTRGMAAVLSRFQTGYLYHYVFAMFVGAVVLVSWYVLRQAG